MLYDIDEHKEYDGAISSFQEKALVQELNMLIKDLRMQADVLSKVEVMLLNNICLERIKKFAYSDGKEEILSNMRRYEPYYAYQNKEKVDSFYAVLEQKTQTLNELRKKGALDENDLDAVLSDLFMTPEIFFMLELGDYNWLDPRGLADQADMAKTDYENRLSYCRKQDEPSKNALCKSELKRLKEVHEMLARMHERRFTMDNDYKNFPALLRALLQ